MCDDDFYGYVEMHEMDQERIVSLEQDVEKLQATIKAMTQEKEQILAIIRQVYDDMNEEFYGSELDVRFSASPLDRMLTIPGIDRPLPEPPVPTEEQL